MDMDFELGPVEEELQNIGEDIEKVQGEIEEFTLLEEVNEKSKEIVGKDSIRSPVKYGEILNWFLYLWRTWKIYGVKCCKESCAFKLVVGGTADINNSQAFLMSHAIGHMTEDPYRCSKCKSTLRNKEEHLLQCEVQTPTEVEFLEANVTDFVGTFHECFPTLNLEDIEMFVMVLENSGSKAKAETYIEVLDKTLEAYMEVLEERSEDDAILRCLIPECGHCVEKRFITEETMQDHILTHFPRPVYFCRSCQVWVRARDTHTDEAHPGRKDTSSLYLDLRAPYQPSLLQLLSDAFRFPEEVIQGKTKGLPGLYRSVLVRTVASLGSEYKDKGYFRCKVKDCEKRFGGQPSEASVENHVVRHLKIKVYTCNICNEKIKYLKEHFKNLHGGAPKEEQYQDHRKRYQTRLIVQLRQCFQNPKDGPRAKGPRKPRANKESTVGHLSNSDFSVFVGKATEYLRLIGELTRTTKDRIKAGESPHCCFPGCELVWNISYITSIERHIMRHSERGFYRCSKCGRCAKRMDDHIRAGACKQISGQARDQYFEDERPENEKVLIDLLRTCFPWYFN